MMEKAKGTVKFFKNDFGFIKSDDAGPDLFVFYQNIVGLGELRSDDRVEFLVGESKRGPMALEVQRI